MSSTGLSHPRALTHISDPIHTRFSFNLFDRDLIDSPYFQRLHFVLQNSVNYVSFPANKNTRFPHSLGVAHTAGRLFSKGLSNSTYEELSPFLDDAADYLLKVIEACHPSTKTDFNKKNRLKHYENLQSAHLMTISGLAGFLHVPIHAKGQTQRMNTEDKVGRDKILTSAFVVDTYWQALRLYGLVHDIGHLPMSHAFETALNSVTNLMNSTRDSEVLKDTYTRHLDDKFEEFSGFQDNDRRDEYFALFSNLLDINEKSIANILKRKDLHEIRGVALYNRYINNHSSIAAAFENIPTADYLEEYAKIIQYLSLSIIFSPSLPEYSSGKEEPSPKEIHKYSFLFALRNIVDGEVDADRLDYTLRDAHESGAHFGNFDLERIVENSLLIRDPEKSLNTFGFHYRGVPGLEQFFEARYQSYKYIIYHRAAARSNSCVEHLVALLFTHAYQYPTSQFVKIMERYGYIRTDKSGQICELMPNDDKFIFRVDDSTFRTLLFEIKSLLDNIESCNLEKIFENKELVQLLKIDNLCNIILHRAFRHIFTLFKNIPINTIVFSAINKQLSLRERGLFLQYLIGNIDEYMIEIRKKLSDEKKFGDCPPIEIMVSDMKPKVYISENPEKTKFEENIWVKDGNDNLRRISDVSPSLRDMKSRLPHDRQFYIYLVSKDIKINENAKSIENSTKIVERVQSFLIQFVRNKWVEYDGMNNIEATLERTP